MPSRARIRTVIAATACASLLSIATPSTPASAGSLFWFKGSTNAPNERICLSFALDQARKNPLLNIQHDALSVSGTKGPFTAVLTCIGTFVVVMVSGNTGEDGGELARDLFDAV